MTGRAWPVTGSLCTGYGGLELGLAMAGARHRLGWYAENAPELVAVLARAWPRSPNLGDIRAVDWAGVEGVDLMCAGFPCQTVSVAGRQAGDADARWLWPHVYAAIKATDPRAVLIENVRNLVSYDRGRLFDGICRDLTGLGYGVRWLTLGACHVGMAHHRHRVFILARPGGGGVERVATTPCGAGRAPLLPTMTARDGHGRGAGDVEFWRRRDEWRNNGKPLDATLALLPTPRARDIKGAETAATRRGRIDRGTAHEGYDLPTAVTLFDLISRQLLPTPRATDGTNGGPGQRGSSGDLALPSAVQFQHFGRFAPAVALHASLWGDPPAPTEPNSNGAPRLRPEFAEWLMGIPAGRVTASMARNDALRAIGNGVCPPQAALAWLTLTAHHDPT